MHKRLSQLPVLLIIAALLVTWWGTVSPTYADAKVVGDGTPASCTETALATVLSGGGTVTFACGGAYTIPITNMLVVMDDTVIDGGGLITLDGRGATRIFYLNKWNQHSGMRFALQNITLTNGLSGGDLDPHFGGCLYSRKSVLQISHVVFTGCKAMSGGGVYVYGGNATVSESTFTNNEAKDGGALHAVSGGETEADMIGHTTVVSSTFTGNVARRDGGAIYMGDSPLDVQHSTFTSNAALGITGEPYGGLGGGVYTNLAGAVATISDTLFLHNMSHESGGGMFADYYTTSAVTNSQFVENTSDNYGGGLSTVRSNMTVDSTEFHKNHGINGGAIFNGSRAITITASLLAENTGEGGGGGIFNGGKRLTLIGSSIISNTAGTTATVGMQGGGLVSYSNTMTVTISGSTFAGNQAIGASASGGGIWFGGTTMTITNTTISGNSAASYGGGIEHNAGATSISNSTIADNTAPGSSPTIGINNGTLILTNTLVVGNDRNCNKEVTDGGHNLQSPSASCGASIPVVDPLLSTLSDNGGRTQTIAIPATSPAVDQGAGCPLVDQRGYARVGQCDIGAFEFGSSGPPTTTLQLSMPVVQSIP